MLGKLVYVELSSVVCIEAIHSVFTMTDYDLERCVCAVCYWVY